jgi:hypothetical protein
MNSMGTVLIRFLVGGVVVSLFAALGDALRPKSFAGLFGAAPSIALATLGLTIRQNGKAYAVLECRSMMLGALGSFLHMRYRSVGSSDGTGPVRLLPV